VRRTGAIASLFVRLDRSSDRFLQQQICHGLRQSISGGVLRPGTRLPSTRALAAELGVSRTTVVAALLQLVEEGYLVARERSGTFVAPALPGELGEAHGVTSRDTVSRSGGDRSGGEAAPGEERGSAAGASAAASAPVHLSRRVDELARAANAAALDSARPRPRAFRLSRPALDAFPVREWTRILSRRAARVSAAQLDYGPESPELRAAIAELCSSARGMRVHGEQVLLFGGGQRALEFAVAAIIDPGERVWMEDPGYPGARSVLAAAGAAITCVPVDREGMVVAAGETAA